MINDPGRTEHDVPSGTNLRLVRLRLVLALLGAAIVPIAIATPVLVRAGIELQGRLAPAEASAVAARLGGDLTTIGDGIGGLGVDGDLLTAVRGDSRGLRDARADLERFAGSIHGAFVGAWLIDPAGDVPLAQGPSKPPVDPVALVDATMPLSAGELLRPDRSSAGAASSSALGSDFLLAVPVRPATQSAASRGALLVRISSDALLADALAGLDAQALVLDGAGTPAVGGATADVAGFSNAIREPIGAAGFGDWSVLVQSRPVGFELSAAWFLGTLALGFVALLLVWWLARQVIRPARQLEQASERLSEMYRSARTDALEDALTGLGNHRAFMEEFDRQLESARRYNAPVSLLLVDLDDFKLVNDSAGHAVGDELLMEVGRLLRSTLRRPDRPFRIGGDEFAVLMPHTDSGQAEIVARRLLAQCVEHRRGSAFPRPFSFSGGISCAPEFGMTRTEVFAQADTALYASKHSGRTAVQVFDPAHARPTIDQQTLSALSAAVSRVVTVGALRPVYQPIVDLRTGRVVGFEGLVRPDPDSGFTDPTELFMAAESTGRTLELDRACLEAVVAGARQIGPDQSLSLNVSPRSLEAPEFSPASLLSLLRHHGLDPARITLELTEREAVEDVERLRHVLAACQQSGLRIAADDVGAGNAGLRLLSQIHFDIVKIDLSLVQIGAQRESSLAVLRALTELAERWGAMVVAEGVETPDQLRVVQGLGMYAAQGYLLGRPGEVPAARQVDLAALLAMDGSVSMRTILAAGLGSTSGVPSRP